MPSLEITQIDHVSVVISNIERSRHFYRDVMGLKEMAKPKTFDFKVVWFDLGNQQLHLLLKPAPDSISPRHFALRVKSRRGSCAATSAPEASPSRKPRRSPAATASSFSTRTKTASKSSNGWSPIAPR